MFVVAICELKSTPEIEAQALARDLGGTAYEHRLHLAAGFPAIVLTTADRELARRTLAALKQRDQAAVFCDSSEVVASENMLAMRRFELEPDGVVVTSGPSPARLDGSDVLALLRATHRVEVESREETKSKQFSVGRALVSGGLMLSKTVKREERSSETDIQQVLYVFRKSREIPWILRERGTHFGGLGTELGPSSLQNFMTTIGRLRALAPSAVYDERLLKFRRASGPPIKSGSFGSQSIATSSAGTIDLAAHLLALWIRER